MYTSYRQRLSIDVSSGINRYSTRLNLRGCRRELWASAHLERRQSRLIPTWKYQEKKHVSARFCVPVHLVLRSIKPLHLPPARAQCFASASEVRVRVMILNL
ncbi:unnamed protein product [Cylicocyclus nassatus]|uniref:Uncharacterized protein n=1 Tax=Cylicocyclus nassatus TaxID=53992 RepID=A0AA36MGA8_CYLNA|nr:unnamed protein product [Cylicocyclus nassatus]